MKRLLIIIAAAMALAACHKISGFDKAQIADSTVRICVKKSEAFRYDALKCQMSFNKSLRLFRAGTDTMSDYFIIKMSAVPQSAGQIITADLEWTTPTGVNSQSGVSFEVVQVDSDNNAWLWSARQEISVVMKVLQ